MTGKIMQSHPHKKTAQKSGGSAFRKLAATFFYKVVDRKTAHAVFEKCSALSLAGRLLWLRIVCSLTHRPLVVVSLVEHCGDIVACEPVARYLRTQYPNMYLVWVCTSKYVELLRYHPDINEVAQITCLTSWLRVRGLKLGHHQIDLQINGRFCLMCRNPIVNQGSHQQITVDNYYNFGALLPAFCLAAGLPALNDSPQFHFPADMPERTDSLNLPDRFIVFHCCSNEVTRDWDIKKWHSLKKLIAMKFGIPIVEVGLKSIFTEPNDSTYINLCGQLSLLGTAAVIARSTLFVGVDSGPAHIANAARCPGVILLGLYNHFANRLPFTGFFANDGAIIVRTPEALSSLSVEEVFEAIEKKLSATIAEPICEPGSQLK
jgi:ADP-heptose:LPS heptosyltransferase